MSIYIEDYSNVGGVVKNHGLNTQKPVVFESTLAVSGATSFTVAPTGPQLRTTNTNTLVGATVVLTAAQSGQVFINRSTSGTPSWTLPTAADGLWYTFMCASTSAGFTVTGGTIFAKANPAGAAITGTTLTHTQGSAVVGDTITLICDGTSWRMAAQGGTFAAS